MELEYSTRRGSPRPGYANGTARGGTSDGDAYREDDAPVGDGAPEVGGLWAHGAVQERLERRRHGGEVGRRAGDDGDGVRGCPAGEGGWPSTILRSCWSERRGQRRVMDGMMATVDPYYYLSCRPAALEAIS